MKRQVQELDLPNAKNWLWCLAFALQCKTTITLNTTPASIYLADLLLPLIFCFLKFNTSALTTRRYIIFWFMAFLTLVTINYGFYGALNMTGAKKIMGFGIMFGYCLVGLQLRSYLQENWVDLLRCIIISAWIMGAILIFYSCTFYPAWDLPLIQNGRFFGLVDNANAYGIFYVFVMATSTIITAEQKIISTLIDKIGQIISLVCIFYSGSRSAMITLGLLAIMSLRYLKLQKLLIILPVLLIIGGIIFFKSDGSLYSFHLDVWQVKDNGLSTRLAGNINAFETWLTAPLFGVGLGNYYTLYASKLLGSPQDIHNTFLAILTEVGVAGLLLWLALPLLLFYYRDKGTLQTKVLIVVLLIAGIAGMANDLAFQRYIWLIIGLTAGKISLRKA